MSKSTPTPTNESPETVSSLIGEATKLQAEAARYAKLAENASKRVTFYLEHGAAIGTAARYVAEKAGVVAKGDKGQGGDSSSQPSVPPAGPKPKTNPAPAGIKVKPVTEWITVSEASRRSGIATGTLCREASRGKFRTNGLKDHDRRFDAADFQRWVDSRNPRRISAQKFGTLREYINS
jgi:hypothetical protein